MILRSESELMQGLKAAELPVTDLRHRLPRHESRAWGKRDPAGIQGVVYHHAASTGTFEAVANYHIKPNHISSRGLPSISYTMGIDTDGTIALFNDFVWRTYSQGYSKRPGDENAEFMAVLIRGNLWSPHNPNGHDPTEKQLFSAAALYDWLHRNWGLHPSMLFGHYHFGKALCPGSAVKRLIETIRGDVVEPTPTMLPEKQINLVADRQIKLKTLGHYSGNIDGIWGPQSDSALRAFQAESGLYVDGIWGRNTEAAMKAALAAK